MHPFKTLEATVIFYLYINGKAQPEKITLGSMPRHPAKIPFSLAEPLPRHGGEPSGCEYMIWNSTKNIGDYLLSRYEVVE